VFRRPRRSWSPPAHDRHAPSRPPAAHRLLRSDFLGLRHRLRATAAGLSGRVTFTTDYVFRGVTQTNNRPTVQGALEHLIAPGVYAGLFASNLSWAGDAWQPVAPGVDPNVYGGSAAISNSLEIIGYAGARRVFPNGFRGDAGVVHYHYPGSYDLPFEGLGRPNTTVVHIKLGWRWVTSGMWYALSDTVFMIGDTTGTRYFNLAADMPLGATGLQLHGSVGYWDWNGAMPFYRIENGGVGSTNSMFNLTDYRISVSKDWSGFTWSATFTGSTARKTVFGSYGFETAAWGNRLGSNVGDQTLFVSARRSI
jgi:uncharacterized protein (TIGR02001 family)